MPLVVPPTFPPISEPPDSNDMTNFDSRADTYLDEQRTIVRPSVIAIGEASYQNALYAQAQAEAAGVSATNAATQVSLATTQAGNALTARNQAEAFAQTALLAPGTGGTSATSLAISAGTKSFNTQTGKSWVAGQPVVLSRTATPTAVQMYGTIASYNSSTGEMSVDVPARGLVGSGTFSDWTIALTGRQGRSDLALVSDATASISVNVWQRVLGTNAAQITFTLPASPAVGDMVSCVPVNGRADNLIAFGANKHMNISDASMTINVIDAPVTLEWTGPDYGWKIV